MSWDMMIVARLLELEYRRYDWHFREIVEDDYPWFPWVITSNPDGGLYLPTESRGDFLDFVFYFLWREEPFSRLSAFFYVSAFSR
jgi:hypothetical protein